MKLLRITGLIIFLLSALSYTSFRIYEEKTIDATGPEINYQNDNLTLSINSPEEDLLQGITAIDDKDGDVTKSTIIESVSKFTGIGKRTITYAAFDSSNNITKNDRQLIYSDYTPPRFALSSPLSFIIGEEDILQYMTATDCIDGDLTKKIKYDLVDYDFGSQEGTFQVKFHVTNSAGDTAYLPAEVEFRYPSYEDQDRIPEIILSNYLIYLKTGDYFNAKDYLQGVTVGQVKYSFGENYIGNSKSNVISKNLITLQLDPNMQEPGVHQVNYSMSTEDGYTGTTKLLVVVED